MSKGVLKKAVIIITVITGILTAGGLVFNFLIPIYLSNKLNLGGDGARAIGIIGGADGPTAIFLTGGSWSNFTVFTLAALTLLGIIYLTINKRR